MLTPMYYLNDARVRINSISNLCKSETTLESSKDRVDLIMFDVVVACEDLLFTIYDSRYVILKREMIRLKQENLLTDSVDRFKEVAQSIVAEISKLREIIERDMNDSYWSLESLVSNPVKNLSNRRRDIALYNISKLSSFIKEDERHINILDLRAFNGENLKNFAFDIKDKTLYGLSGSHIDIGLKENVDKFAYGNLSGGRISNEAFDALLCDPEISISSKVSSSGFLMPKIEKTTIISHLKYLRVGGAIALIFPYFKMYKDMCIFLSKNLSNIQVRSLSDHTSNTGAVCIVGIKKADKEVDRESFSTLSRVYEITNVEDISRSLFDKITIAQDELPIETFRGSILDEKDIINAAESSGLLNQLLKKQLETNEGNFKSPLLPFNIGQIGLVLTSGCLDGIIEEDDGHRHLIRGRVSKQKTTETEYSSGQSEMTTVTSNKVEINVLLPDGEYKILA